MTADGLDRGVVIMCDAGGVVKRVVRDDLGVADRIPAGSRLGDLVDPAVREKVGAFFAVLREHDAAYDWEITVPVGGRLVALHFAGARVDLDYLIMATMTRNGLTHLHEELARINNEQTNLVRSTAQALARAVGSATERDDVVYEELTRLNNDMANMQRELAKKNAQLEQLNQQKNRLLGMAAHDLRSPLGVIMTYAEFLLADAAGVLTAQQLEFLSTIRETSRFMARMVTDMLDVTAIEAGQLRLDRSSVDLVSLTEHNVALNRVLAARKEIGIEFDAPLSGEMLQIDAGKVEQVLNNLIGNAVKFSHRGTTVVVRLDVSPTEVTVSIQDQGQGIPAGEIPKLFRPFGTTSVRGTDGEPSTGLGLAIVRRMIEGHGGRIWVESVVGTGSTFFFSLPCDPPLEAPVPGE